MEKMHKIDSNSNLLAETFDENRLKLKKCNEAVATILKQMLNNEWWRAGSWISSEDSFIQEKNKAFKTLCIVYRFTNFILSKIDNSPQTVQIKTSPTIFEQSNTISSKIWEIMALLFHDVISETSILARSDISFSDPLLLTDIVDAVYNEDQDCSYKLLIPISDSWTTDLTTGVNATARLTVTKRVNNGATKLKTVLDKVFKRIEIQKQKDILAGDLDILRKLRKLN